MKTKYFIIPIISLLLAGPVHAQTGATSNTTGTNTTTGTVNNGSSVNTNSTIGGTIPGGFGATNRTNVTVPSNMNSRQFDSFVTSRWDTDGDGTISRSEWDASSPSWFSNNPTNSRSFRAWDGNNNGRLDSPELQGFFSNSRLYQLYDSNGDGVIDSTEATRIPVQ